MTTLPHASDLTAEELVSLRLILSRSFMSKNALPAAHRLKLLKLGMIQQGMGGILPTPAGRMAARVAL